VNDIYKKDWRKLKIACFDTETTGTNINDDRITEMGIIIFKKGEPIKKYCRLINPKKKIHPKAAKVSGITDSDVKEQRTFKQRFKKIYKLLYGADLWCAFNDQFDRGIMAAEFRRCGEEYEDKPCIDPRIWADHMWPGQTNNLDSVSARLRVNVPRTVTDELKINVARHRADYDSLVTGYCLFAMMSAMPKTLRQTLYVQDYIYRRWLTNVYNNNPRFARSVEPTMPPEHVR